MKKILNIIKEAIPVVIMIALIPIVSNDYYLTLIYLGIILISLTIKRQRNDLTFLIFGFVALAISEYFFIKTGVEIFARQSLLGVMPLWLPVLWAYAFVAIKRSIMILG